MLLGQSPGTELPPGYRSRTPNDLTARKVNVDSTWKNHPNRRIETCQRLKSYSIYQGG